MLVAGGLDAVARAQLVDVVGVVMPVANTLAVSRAAAVPDEVMRRRRGHWAAGVREQREKTRSTQICRDAKIIDRPSRS